MGNINSIMPVSDAGRQGQRIVYGAPVGVYYGRGYDSRNPTPRRQPIWS